jgi:hypothetical protein
LGVLFIMILILGRENWCQSFLGLSKMGNGSSLIYIYIYIYVQVSKYFIRWYD